MGQSEELARQFEETNRRFVEAVQNCSDEKWRSTPSGEQRSVGTIAHHVATSHMQVVGIAQSVGSGAPAPAITMEMIDQGNAQHASQNPNPSREETLGLLQQDGEKAAGIIRSMTDEQLAKTLTMPAADSPITTAQFIEMVGIGHPAGHMQSLTT
jgi:hypothetical protein